jgi:hypothetical protein
MEWTNREIQVNGRTAPRSQRVEPLFLRESDANHITRSYEFKSGEDVGHQRKEIIDIGCARPQHDDRYATVRDALLMRHVLIDCDQHIKAPILRSSDELAVSEAFQPHENGTFGIRAC